MLSWFKGSGKAMNFFLVICIILATLLVLNCTIAGIASLATDYSFVECFVWKFVNGAKTVSAPVKEVVETAQILM